MLFYWTAVLLVVAANHVKAEPGTEDVTCEVHAAQFDRKMISGFLDMTVALLGKVQDTGEQPEHDLPPPCPKRPVDCSELRKCGHGKSGLYKVFPWSRVTPKFRQIEVYCDMETDGGGWTVIQRRGNFGKMEVYFNRKWTSYKKGFGNKSEDFWLGNDKIFSLTNQRGCSLRIDLKDFDGESRYAEYDSFYIDDEDHKYTLHVEGYRGTAGDSFEESHTGMKFSTLHQDNDMADDVNCAFNCESGWWFKSCYASNLNGPYHPTGEMESEACGVEWLEWKGGNYSLAETEMKIRPIGFKI